MIFARDIQGSWRDHNNHISIWVCSAEPPRSVGVLLPCAPSSTVRLCPIPHGQDSVRSSLEKSNEEKPFRARARRADHPTGMGIAGGNGSPMFIDLLPGPGVEHRRSIIHRAGRTCGVWSTSMFYLPTCPPNLRHSQSKGVGTSPLYIIST